MIAEPRAPMPLSLYEFIVAAACCLPPEPILNRFFVEVNKNTLAELLYCRQPIGVLRKRRAAHRELDIFKIAIGVSRSRFRVRAQG